MSTFGKATNLCTSLRRRLVVVVVVIARGSRVCVRSAIFVFGINDDLSGAPCVFACRNFNKIDKTMRIHVHSVLARSLARPSVLFAKFVSNFAAVCAPRLVPVAFPFLSSLYMCIFVCMCVCVSVYIFFTI